MSSVIATFISSAQAGQENAIYIFAVVFAVLMAYFGIYYICWRENLIYLKAQLRMLSVGQVRRNLLSSQDKDGCIIYVVKAIEKNKITSDTYIKKKGEYVLDKKDVELSVKEFFSLTDPEPVFKEERVKICSVRSTTDSSKE